VKEVLQDNPKQSQEKSSSASYDVNIEEALLPFLTIGSNSIISNVLY